MSVSGFVLTDDPLDPLDPHAETNTSTPLMAAAARNALLWFISNP
jgi:hypothetical protein